MFKIIAFILYVSGCFQIASCTFIFEPLNKSDMIFAKNVPLRMLFLPLCATQSHPSQKIPFLGILILLHYTLLRAFPKAWHFLVFRHGWP